MYWINFQSKNPIATAVAAGMPMASTSLVSCATVITDHRNNSATSSAIVNVADEIRILSNRAKRAFCAFPSIEHEAVCLVTTSRRSSIRICADSESRLEESSAMLFGPYRNCLYYHLSLYSERYNARDRPWICRYYRPFIRSRMHHQHYQIPAGYASPSQLFSLRLQCGDQIFRRHALHRSGCRRHKHCP